jgi:hypothetical protein
MKTPGEIIINAVIRAAAIDKAIVEENGTIYIWAANAPEQIEAAIVEAGWLLVKKDSDSE